MEQDPMQPEQPERPADQPIPETPAQGPPLQPYAPYTQEAQPPQQEPQPQTTVYSPYTPPPSQRPQPEQPYAAPPPMQPAEPVQPYYGGQPGAPPSVPPYDQQPLGQAPYAPPPQYPQQQAGGPQGIPPAGQYPQYGPGYAPPAQAPRKSGGVPVWLWVVGGLVLAVLLGCGLITFLIAQSVQSFGKSVERSFSSISVSLGNPAVLNTTLFYSELSSGQFESARQYLSQDMKDKYGADELRSMWQKLEDAQGKIVPGFPEAAGSSSKAATTATVNQTLTSSKGQNYPVTLTLEDNGNGEWLITGASPSLIPEP